MVWCVRENTLLEIRPPDNPLRRRAVPRLAKFAHFLDRPTQTPPFQALGSLSSPGETVLPRGETIFPCGETIFPCGETIFPAGETVFPTGGTVFPTR
jgi:hypothetical protein